MENLSRGFRLRTTTVTTTTNPLNDVVNSAPRDSHPVVAERIPRKHIVIIGHGCHGQQTLRQALLTHACNHQAPGSSVELFKPQGFLRSITPLVPEAPVDITSKSPVSVAPKKRCKRKRKYK